MIIPIASILFSRTSIIQYHEKPTIRNITAVNIIYGILSITLIFAGSPTVSKMTTSRKMTRPITTILTGDGIIRQKL